MSKKKDEHNVFESIEDRKVLTKMFMESKMQLQNVNYLIQRSTEAKGDIENKRQERVCRFYDRRVDLMEKYFERNSINPLSKTKQFIDHVKEK